MLVKKPSSYTETMKRIVPSEKYFNILDRDTYVAEGRIAFAYRYFGGPVVTRFFTELRDKKRLSGIKCPQCNIVYVPPRATCGRCFGQMTEWKTVGNAGTLLAYTVTHYHLKIHPVNAPLTYGIIQLDGADTGFTHLIGEIDISRIHIGMRVEAVFEEQRQGNILDIKYFRPL